MGFVGNSTTRLFHFPYQAPVIFVLIGLFLRPVFPQENNILPEKIKMRRWYTRTEPAVTRSPRAKVTGGRGRKPGTRIKAVRENERPEETRPKIHLIQTGSKTGSKTSRSGQVVTDTFLELGKRDRLMEYTEEGIIYPGHPLLHGRGRGEDDDREIFYPVLGPEFF